MLFFHHLGLKPIDVASQSCIDDYREGRCIGSTVRYESRYPDPPAETRTAATSEIIAENLVRSTFEIKCEAARPLF